MLTKIEESVQNPPDKIGVGDTIMVTKPEFVDRVGYPLSFEDAKEWVRKNCVQDLERLLTFGEEYIPPSEIFKMEYMDIWQGREEKRILSALAKLYQQKMGYGGKERRIHTYRNDDYLGRIFEVKEKCRVVTGDYYPPYTEWGDEPERIPGGLDKVKHHILLNIDWTWHQFGCPKYHKAMWIEACNVKKIR